MNDDKFTIESLERLQNQSELKAFMDWKNNTGEILINSILYSVFKDQCRNNQWLFDKDGNKF